MTVATGSLEADLVLLENEQEALCARAREEARSQALREAEEACGQILSQVPETETTERAALYAVLFAIRVLPRQEGAKPDRQPSGSPLAAHRRYR